MTEPPVGQDHSTRRRRAFGKLRIWPMQAAAGLLLIAGVPFADGGLAMADAPANCSGTDCLGQRLPSTFDPERARRNYLAVARGSKSFGQLSLVERREVLALIDLLERNRFSDESGYERCVDQQLGGRTDASELELRLIDLKCAMH